MITVGKVVQFVDSNNEKSAGTVIEIVKRDGVKSAIINVIDGSRTVKPLGDLFEVKNSVKGKRSSTVLKEVAEKLGKEIATPSSNGTETKTLPSPKEKLENLVKGILEEKSKLEEENKELKRTLSQSQLEIKQCSNILDNERNNSQKMKSTISCLSSVIEDLVDVDFKASITKLTNCIKELHSIPIE